MRITRKGKLLMSGAAAFVAASLLAVALLLFSGGEQAPQTASVGSATSAIQTDAAPRITQDSTTGHVDELEAPVRTLKYYCDGDKKLTARIETKGDKAEVFLMDGRKLLVRSVSSSAGHRYARGSDTAIFWYEGDEAYVQERGVRTYGNCGIAR